MQVELTFVVVWSLGVVGLFDIGRSFGVLS